MEKMRLNAVVRIFELILSHHVYKRAICTKSEQNFFVFQDLSFDCIIARFHDRCWSVFERWTEAVQVENRLRK